MTSHSTTFCLVNISDQPITITDVTVASNQDWDGSSRPDHNLTGQTVTNNDALWEPEEVNARVSSADFTMTLAVGTTGTLVLNLNQYDALTAMRKKIAPVGGTAEALYEVVQMCGFRTNSIYILPILPRNMLGWMGALAARNPNLQINQLTMPGSHDAGMYTAESTTLAQDSWAQTQFLSIYDQLRCGSRYFDLRVYWDGTQFRMGHFSKLIPNDSPAGFYGALAGASAGALGGGAALGPVGAIGGAIGGAAIGWGMVKGIVKQRHDCHGAWGPPLTDVLEQVSDFMELDRAAGECVFLKFSHTGDGAPVEQPANNLTSIISMVNNALSPYLYRQTPGTNTLQSMTLRELAGRVVTVYGDEFAALYDNSTGVFPYVDVSAETAEEYTAKSMAISDGLQCFDRYSNTTSLQVMLEDQTKLLNSFGGYGRPYLFLYSWTLTAGMEQTVRTDGDGNVVHSVEGFKDYFGNLWGGATQNGGVVLDVAALSAVCNPILFNQLNVLSRSSTLPNIVYCDFIDPYIGQAVVAVNG